MKLKHFFQKITGKHRRWNRYNYFSVSFNYPGPYVNIPYDDEYTTSALDHTGKIEQLLEARGVVFIHQYFWPDGSMYKFVRSMMTENDVRVQLEDIFDGTEYSIEDVRQESALYEHHGSPLGERFDR